MNFRLVPKSVTLNGVMAIFCVISANSGSFRRALRKSSRSLSHLLMSSCIILIVIRYFRQTRGFARTQTRVYGFENRRVYPGFRVPGYPGCIPYYQLIRCYEVTH